MRTTVFSRIHLLALPVSVRCARVLPLAAVATAFALGGCTSARSMFSSSANEPGTVKGVVAWLSPYRPDIIQGNVVTTDQLKQVKPGMGRTQVRDILGTPLITDPFHAQRWDYVFTLRRQGFDDQERAFHVDFDSQDKVEKVDAPVLPSEEEFIASISRRPLPTKTPVLELTDAQKAALPAPKVVASAASSATPEGPTRTYPPLESK